MRWCTVGSAVGSASGLKFNESIVRIRAKGAICATLADAMTRLLDEGKVRLYAAGSLSTKAATPVGGDWSMFSHEVVNTGATPDTTMKGLTLDWAIAHEMDHLLNNHPGPPITNARGHMLRPDGTADDMRTVNSNQCK